MAVYNNTFINEIMIIHSLLQNIKQSTCYIFAFLEATFDNGNVCLL
jgi:hypothetical protein